MRSTQSTQSSLTNNARIYAHAALQITTFRVPSYVPITLPQTADNAARKHPLDLAKPIIFDCDYTYDALEDTRLAVRWFRNKESEPFYQWLPELNRRHFADWIAPLIDATFVSDAHDPLKRYRSLLITRLSMNLTGVYQCVVSSLAGQDARQASLVMYQPPSSFEFEHRIYPAPELSAPVYGRTQQQQQQQSAAYAAAGPRASPTQFKGLATAQQPHQASIVRPPNNDQQAQQQQQQLSQSEPDATKIVYTHDGRPIARKRVRRKRATQQRYAIQLHLLQCHASQVTPRPVIVLSVKRQPDSIAQFLHEASSTFIRPYQVAHEQYYEKRANMSSSSLLPVTLFDITVSATVALNVTLPDATDAAAAALSAPAQTVPHTSTVIGYRRGQRMSFECHLELTGTEFEQRKRININDEGKQRHTCVASFR